MKKKKHQKTNEEIDEAIFDTCNTCSTTDCTGLIPAAPTSQAEIEAYEELYPFRPPIIPVEDDENEF